jgi:hypothetical protein
MLDACRCFVYLFIFFNKKKTKKKFIFSKKIKNVSFMALVHLFLFYIFVLVHYATPPTK